MKQLLRVLLPLPCNGVGPSHICHALCEQMRDPLLEVRLYTPRATRGQGRPWITEALPIPFRYLPWSMIRDRGSSAVEKCFSRDGMDHGTAYLWSEPSLDFARQLNRRGVTTIREKYNCHKAVARKILEEAYARLGVEAKHGIGEDRIAKEREELALADWIVCPSECVRQSLISEGVDPRKLIDSSYGWSAARFEGSTRLVPAADGLTVLFAGAICVRKGAHLLLRAWSESRIKGRLLLVGSMEETIASSCADLLNRPDILVKPFTHDIGAAFRSADVFAFPSLEEGDPLVTYEAAANGLPAVVSPMGAGRSVRHGREGFVLDPYDVDAWADVLSRLSSDPDLLRALGEAATKRASEFTWARVGADRRAKLLGCFGCPATHRATDRPAEVPRGTVRI